MKKHTSCYNVEEVRPKHHWAFDVAQQRKLDEAIFDAFVIERLHLRVRNIADNVKATFSFERSVLSGVVNEHARRGLGELSGGGLLGKTAPFPGAQGALVSDKAELCGLRVAVGDVVFRNDQMGVVAACCVEDDELLLVVDEGFRVRQVSDHSSEWCLNRGARQVWRVADVEECGAWKAVDASGKLIALRL